MGNPHSVVVACFSSRVCLLAFVLWGLIMPALAVGQRSVSYSANIGSFAIQAANGSGDSCLWTGTALTKLKADNSVAYAIQRSSLSVVAVGIDAPGNCYLAVQNGSVSVLKFNTSGSADPTFTTFVLPGSVAPQVKAMVVDVSGNIYLAGSTTNTIDFPEVANAQNSYAGGLSDGFVLKIAADGNHLIYSTYLGGSSADVVNCIAVDSAGAAYVAGQTFSLDFPTHAALIAADPATQPPPVSGTVPGTTPSGFVTKFGPGGTLVYSSYLGGTSPANAEAIAVDSASEVYVGGDSGPNFPLVNPLTGAAAGTGDNAFLSKINATGSAFLWSTFYSQSSYAAEAIQGIALDGAENVYFAGPIGCTLSGIGPCSSPGGTGVAQIPLINPVQKVFAGSTNLFVGEIAPTGDVLLFSTLLGGPGNDSFQSIGVDSGGNIIIVGQAGDALGDGFLIHGFFGEGFEFPMVNADSQPFGNGTEPFNGSSLIGQQGLTFLVRLNQTAGVSFSVPSKIDFTGSAPQVAGQAYPIAAPIQIGNYGTTNVQISSIDVSGDFTGTNNCPAVLTAGSTTTLCSISLVFAPTASGSRSGAITIHDDAPGNPHVISLVNATASSGASLTISPLSLTFPSQQIGTTSPAQVITLQNPSTAPLSISHIVAAGDFSEVTTCTATLTASCTISVTFTPTSSGSRSGTITITDGAADSPQVVTLSGSGATSPALTPAVGQGSQTVTAGQTANYTLTPSGFSGTVNFTCAGAPHAATCTISPTSLVVSGSSSSNIIVNVSTTAVVAGLAIPAAPNHRWRSARSADYALIGVAFLISFIAIALYKLPAGFGRIIAAASLVSAAFLAGCGGGASQAPGPGGTPAGSYTITVTAASGSTSVSANLALIVR